MITKGITYILIATLSFAFMNVMAKDLSDFHPMQVVFLRAFGTFIFIFPYMLYKRAPLIGNNPGLLLLRGLAGLTSLTLFFIAIQRIPLGSALSIRYLGPIFGAVFAFLFLKERIGKWQWVSFLIAFSGVIFLKGFDIRIDLLSLILVIVSAVFIGIVFVMLRFLSLRENYLTIINYFMVISILVSSCFMIYWRMPIGREWISVTGIGISGLFGQIFMTKAFQTEETSVLAPFKYMELVYALAMGFFFFGESYTILPFLGILLIISGMILNLYAKKWNQIPNL